MTKKELVLKIQRARLLKRLTQQQLADSLKVHVQRVSSIERGEVNITLDNLVDVCDAVDLEIKIAPVAPNSKNWKTL